MPSFVCFWNRASPKVSPRTLISIGPGSPHVVRFIVSPEAQDDSWHVLGSSDQPPIEKENNRDPERKEVLDDPERPLAGLLRYLNGSESAH